MSELELVTKLVKKLKREGFRVATEVSNMGQSADIVATRGRWVTLVEVKRNNWPRALQQCRAHEQVADFICIAIALASIPQKLEQDAVASGYGLLHYQQINGRFEWVVRPRLNKSVWRPQRRHWSRARRRIRDGN